MAFVDAEFCSKELNLWSLESKTLHMAGILNKINDSKNTGRHYFPCIPQILTVRICNSAFWDIRVSWEDEGGGVFSEGIVVSVVLVYRKQIVFNAGKMSMM